MRKHISILLSVSAFLCSSFALSAQSTASQDTMYQDKTAEYNYETQSGTITLENYVPGEMKVARDAKPIDAILVLDFSSSMEDSYSVDSTYSKVIADKRYCATNMYWYNGKNYKEFGPESSVKTTRNEKAYSDKNGTAIQVKYNGTNYDVYVIHTIDPNWAPSQSEQSTSKSRSWAYITVNSKRVFIRQDGSFIEESGSTTVAYNTFPSGTDGYLITPAELDERTILTTLKTVSGYHTTTRIAALQFAAGRFIELVSKHASETNKKDRLAIVIFDAISDNNFPSFYSATVSDYLNSSSKTYLMECPTDKKPSGKTDGNIEGKSFVAKRFVDMSTQNAETHLKYAISDINPVGTTPVNNGVDIAKELMLRSGRQGDSIARYVIVFSDGEPTTTSGGTGFVSGGVADKAVSSAYTLKTSTTHKSTIFTIYCNSENPNDNTKTFMDHLSSNYPKSTTYDDDTSKTDTTYFKKAKDNLAVIFNDIAQQIIVETTSKYNVNTTLNDFVNNAYFKLPDEVDQTTAYDNILVYENKCAGYDKTTNTYTWARFEGDSTKLLTKADGITINITKRDQTIATSNDKVEIKGYDFSKNWCGTDISKTPNVAHGARLVIKIPFVYTKTQVFGDLPTNTKDSGITVIDDKGEVIEKKEYPVPTLPFCYIKIQRDSLDKGESAIYLIEKPKDDGTYEFVDKVVVNGSGSKIDTCALYGVPGTKFRVTETNWNWAYDKTENPQIKELPTDSEGKPTSYRLFYEFKGDHIVPTGTEHEKEKNPANLHNHDEAFKVNSLTLPSKKSK